MFSIFRIQVWCFIGGRGHREQDQVCSLADPSNSSVLLSLSSSLTYPALTPSSSRLMCQSQGEWWVKKKITPHTLFPLRWSLRGKKGVEPFFFFFFVNKNDSDWEKKSWIWSRQRTRQRAKRRDYLGHSVSHMSLSCLILRHVSNSDRGPHPLLIVSPH